MGMRLNKDLREFIELLNANRVDYLVVGAFAVAERVVQIGVPPNRIDMITSITGVDFDRAWEGRVQGDLDGIPVQFIGFEDLIRNKESAARPKDLGDADELRKRRAAE